MKLGKRGYGKSSPGLRRLAEQDHARAEWRRSFALRQAAIRVDLPLSDERAAMRGDEPRQTRMNVFLRLNREARSAGPERVSIDIGEREPVTILAKSRLGIASVTEEQLAGLLEAADVASAALAEGIKRPVVLRSTAAASGVLPQSESMPLESMHRGGAGVLVGIIDVDGFDFAHEDFVRDRTTRFVRIWDQGATGPRPSPTLDGRRLYGSEFTREHLNKAIADFDSLSPVERARINLSCATVIEHHQQLFLLRNEGLVHWEGWENGLRGYLALEPIRQWWSLGREILRPEFVEYVERDVLPATADARLHWQP